MNWKKPPPQPLDLAALYDAHGARLYAYALSLLGRVPDAEDAVQDVFAKVQAAGKIPADTVAYLYRSVRNAAYDRLRKRRVRWLAAPRLEYDAHFLQPGPADATLETRDRVEQALRSLPPAQREIVVLKVYHEMTFEAIAAVLDISPHTAASRYRYALEKMRRWLDHEESAS